MLTILMLAQAAALSPPDIELLQKPFRSRELARRIRRALGQPSAADS